MTVHIRDATVDDVQWMASLSRESFAPRFHDYLVSTQSGAARFWEVVLAFPASFPGRRFVVAEDNDGESLGYADLTSAEPGVGHLSYISVVEQARGRGVATELLRGYLDRTPDVHALQLDVFDDNAPARALYDRLGFGGGEATTWWVADLDVGGAEPAPVRLDDLHTSVAKWKTYGFCELSGTAGERSFRFGRLGDGVLRCFNSDDLTARPVVASLRRALPELNRVFAMVPGDDPPASDVGELRRINRSSRMTAPDIRTRLECS